MGHLLQQHPFEFYACVSMETTLHSLLSSFCFYLHGTSIFGQPCVSLGVKVCAV